MSTYITHDELDFIKELYDFHQTQMEGASLNEEQHSEWERKSTLFWTFYDKARKQEVIRNSNKRIKLMVRKARANV